MSLIQSLLTRLAPRKTETPDPFALRLDRIQSREMRHRVRCLLFRAYDQRLAA